MASTTCSRAIFLSALTWSATAHMVSPGLTWYSATRAHVGDVLGTDGSGVGRTGSGFGASATGLSAAGAAVSGCGLESSFSTDGPAAVAGVSAGAAPPPSIIGQP